MKKTLFLIFSESVCFVCVYYFNIKKTLYHKKVKGEYCCPYAPYGYKLDPNDKHHFVIDPPAAEIVRSIFEMYKQGMGYIRIAKILNQKQVPPPGVYKEMQGLNYRNPNAESTSSRQWRDNTIYYILRQEVYTGAIVQGKTKSISYKNKKRIKLPKSEWIIVPNMHEAIIDEDLWNAVKSRIAKRQGNDKQFQTEEQKINPLRGIVYCKECGSGMWRMSYQCTDRRYKYYRCRTVKNSDGMCDNVNSIRQDDLEEIILNELKLILSTHFDPNQIKLHSGQSSESKIDIMQTERKQIDKKIAKLQSDSVQLYRDKLGGLLNDEQFKLLNDNFNDEIKQCQKRLSLITAELENLSCEQQKKLTKEDVLKKYKSVSELTYELVHELIEGVYVGKVDPQTKEREVEIHWKF